MKTTKLHYFPPIPDGRCVLELAHRGDEGQQPWIPITKKVYWPPTATTNNQDQNMSNGANNHKAADSALQSGKNLQKKLVCTNVMKVEFMLDL